MTSQCDLFIAIKLQQSGNTMSGSIKQKMLATLKYRFKYFNFD